MAVDLSLFKKIRCRFLDQSTGDPVPGVIASLSVAVGGANSVRFPVGILCSDATGYMSFALKPLIDLGVDASGLFISAPRYGLTNYDLLRSFRAATNGTSTYKDASAGSADALANVEATRMPALPTYGDPQGLAFVVFPVYVEKWDGDVAKSEDSTCVQTSLPSIQSPDVWDYRVSPFSFVTPSALRLGNDCCEVLLPSSLPLQQ